MNISFLGTIHLNAFILPICATLSLFVGSFLFWRAGRRELIESNLLFDTFFAGLAGFVAGGRIFDFILSLFSHSFSLKRLIFFNIYSGFSFYGAVLGLIVAVYLLLRRQNIKYLAIFDLIAAPLALARAIFLLGLALKLYINRERDLNFYFSLSLFLVYFICFWVIKRLEKKKRFAGFFISFYLMFTSIFGIIFAFSKKEQPLVFKNIPAITFMLVLFLAIGLVVWYFEGNTKKKIGINAMLALLLLGLFKIKRVFTSLSEADGMAKAIVLSPYSLVKVLLSFVKLTVDEVFASFVDLVRAFGFKK